MMMTKRNMIKMGCKKICLKYETKRSYDYGKKCAICDVFLDIVENKCPCCGNRLRARGRTFIKNLNLSEASKFYV